MIATWGLNTKDYKVFPPYSAELPTYWPPVDIVSARVYDPVITGLRLFAFLDYGMIRSDLLLLNEKYSILIDEEPCNPHDCLICGNMLLTPYGIDGSGTAEFEVITGPGTVRDVETKGQYICTHLRGYVRELGYDELGNALTIAKYEALKFPYWPHVIFEFGFFNHPTGWMKKPLLFWEVRSR